MGHGIVPAEKPKVFLSYSVEDEAHNAWVRQFAAQLDHDGVEVLFDIQDVHPGDDAIHFMEWGIRISSCCVMICTPVYRERYEKRIGGVGFEARIISPEVYSQKKTFIPILRVGAWDTAVPAPHKGSHLVDLTGEPYSEEQYQRLLRMLRGEVARRPPPAAVSSPAEARGVVLYPDLPRPNASPPYFQDREAHVSAILDFLGSRSSRLLVVHGRRGFGKSALVSRALENLESGAWRATVGLFPVRVFPVDRPTAKTLFRTLASLLPEGKRRSLGEGFTEPKLRAMLREEPLRTGRVLLLLDSFEESLDPQTGRIESGSLVKLIRTLRDCPHEHAVKVLLVSSLGEPAGLDDASFDLYRSLALGGLETGDRWKFLRAVDDGVQPVLAQLPEDRVGRVLEQTQGAPFALEHWARLVVRPGCSYEEMLDVRGELREAFVGPHFRALTPLESRVLQALALYGLAVADRGVPARAVEWLFDPGPDRPAASIGATLDRLVERHLVRKDRHSGHYSLHSADRDYALSLLPQGEPSERRVAPTPQTRIALLDRAAAYFHDLPANDMRSSLDHWRAEFDLRMQGEDYAAAAEALSDMGPRLLHWGELEVWLSQLDALRGRVANRRADGFLTLQRGAALLRLGRAGEAVAALHDAIGTASELARGSEEDRFAGLVLETEARNNLVGYYLDRERLGPAVREARRALKLARSIRFPAAEETLVTVGFRAAEGILLGNLGNAMIAAGRPSRARRLYLRARAIAREPAVADVPNELRWRDMLGLCERQMGRFRRARRIQRSSVREARRAGCTEVLRAGLVLEGETLAALALRVEARASYREALELQKDGADPTGEGETYHSLALLDLDEGQHEQAEVHATAALKVGRRLGSRKLKCQAHWALALVALDRGQLDAARVAVEAARTRSIREHAIPIETLRGLIALRHGERAAARRSFELVVRGTDPGAEREATALGPLYSRALALAGLALLGDENREDEAAGTLARALAIGREGRGLLERQRRLVEALDPGRTLAEVWSILETSS